MKQLCKDIVIQPKKQYDCVVCGLSKNRKKSTYYGNGKKKILIIDPEIPSPYFKNLLRHYDINLERDCWVVKPVLCAGRIVTETQLFCCQKEIDKITKELKPKKILTLGTNSLKMLIGPLMSGRLKYGGAQEKKKGEQATAPKLPDKWLEQKIPDQYYQCWIFPLEHYKLLDREHYKKDNSENIFIRSLKTAIYHIDSFYIHNYENECTIVTNVTSAIEIIKHLQTVKVVAFDYETTGIKPHLKSNNHKIRCIGLSDGILSYGIPIFYDNVEFLRELRKLLRSRKVKKYVWNMKFEKQWTECILKAKVNNWSFDGLLGSHVLDNRKEITGLKFQTYVKLGIAGYDDEMDKYLKSKTKGSNEVNRIYLAPLRQLLEYVAMDAHVTFKTCENLKAEIFNDDDLHKAYLLFHNGALALSDASSNGIMTNEERLIKNDLQLEKSLLRIEKEIMEFDEVKKWDQPEVFNFSSNQQLSHLIYDILGYTVHKKTNTGNNSVDIEALGYFEDIPFISKIIEHGKISKMKNTYLAGFKSEIADGILRPAFALNFVRSFRSSSKDPNFQNYPKKNKLAKKMIRSIIIPRPTNMIVEVDYSGAEVCVGASVHRDKNMIKYLQDKSSDMHTDTAADLFLRDVKEICKPERDVAKGFVFAQFYGDWWKQCAEKLWRDMPDSTREHLKKKGYPTLEKYEKLVQESERVFWEVRFLGYHKWKKKTWNNYLNTGYVEFPTGFRIYSNMDRKQACNYPIQGSAFHCLLRGVIEVNKYLQQNQCNTKVIGQIHDSLVLDVDRAEWGLLKPVIRKIMLIDIREEWKWLILPLQAEIDYYYNNWYRKDLTEKFV